MMRILLVFTIFSLSGAGLVGQTLEEYQSLKSEKEAEAAEIEARLKTVRGEIAEIKAKIDALPGWETGFIWYTRF